MQPGDVVTVDVEKPVAGGRMLARHGGHVVLVWGAIPGEQVRVRVERVAARTAYATTVEVLTRSPDRRAVSVDWRCGGNVYAHIAYARQRALKSLVIRDAFARIARFALEKDPPVEASPERGYRMRARLHARSGDIGFFREGSHDLCDPAATGQLLEGTIEAMRDVQRMLAHSAATALQALELTENVAATERAVHLDFEAAADLPAPSSIGDGEMATSLSVSVGGERAVSILGEPYVTEELDLEFGRVRLRRHVRAFFQGNRYMLTTLVARVIAQVPGDDDVLDLYAGGGLFSVPLAARGGSRVVAVEGDAFAGEDLRWNGRLYGRTLRTHRRAVEAYLTDHRAFDGTIIVDPPRTGMSAETTARLKASGARRIVYVSCDVATLARDVKQLLEVGYHIAHVEAFDLFPNTAHVETLVVLAR